MNHPPIPPNCVWFFVETAQKGTYGFELGDDDWWPLTDDDMRKLEFDERPQHYHRKIVASVARGAWLDEAERVIECCDDSHYSKGDWTKLGDLRNKALENAEAWRVWGIA